MSVQSELERLYAIKERIRRNLIAQGVTVPADTVLSDMADQILSVAGEPGADGVGIKSIVRTSGNGAAGTTDTYTITYTNNTTSTFTVYNGKNGTNGTDGSDGKDGANGVSITSVTQTTTSSDDGGENVITVTLSNGNKSTFKVKNGSKGSTGSPGSNGTNGTNGVGISSIRKTSTSGKVDTYTITLSNGSTSTFTVTNGNDGQNGADGDDYVLTSTDKTDIASQAAALIDVSGKLDKSGGTMTGVLTAQNNTSYTTKQVRNIFLIVDGASVPGGADGDICLVYKL